MIDQFCHHKILYFRLGFLAFCLANLSCGRDDFETRISRRSKDPGFGTISENDTLESKAKSGDSTGDGRQNVEEKSSPTTHKLSLGWDQLIRAKSFGIPVSSKAQGKTLRQIVASETPGRDDGQLCSACHNREEAQGGYGLAVDKNGFVTNLDPWEKVGTLEQRPWAGKGGWVSRFIQNKTKPAALKAVMRAWLKGGCKEDQEP